MNPSSTLQYFKKPFFWKLGYLKLNKKAKQGPVLSGEEPEVGTERCHPLAEDGTEEQLSLTAFKGELDSAVSQYLSQVKNLGYRETPKGPEGFKDQKLLAVQFRLSPDDTRDTPSRVLTAVAEDPEENFEEVGAEVPAHDNPLYLTLSECSSGHFLQPEDEEEHFYDPAEHFYENGHLGSSDEEHIYENVENPGGSQDEEHLYDTLPRRHKPDVPPKPDFLSLLAAQQSEPVKRAWNPFVSLSVDTEDIQLSSTSSSLSPPDSNHSSESSEGFGEKIKRGCSKRKNSIQKPQETNEQTIILDGFETSDLGSSGGEDTGSVEDWPLPPTPNPGEEEVIIQDPLPPPPPEIALQELEEEVLREEKNDRRLAIQKEKEAIEKEYGQSYHTYENTCFPVERVEAVNTNILTHKNIVSETAEVEVNTEEQEEVYEEPVDIIVEEVKEEPVDETEKKPRIVVLDEGEEPDFDTPAIRHSVIIELKDSCQAIPQSIKPSDIKKKENRRSFKLKRSESLKGTETVRRSDTRKSLRKPSNPFPLSAQDIRTNAVGSITVGVVQSQKNENFSFLPRFHPSDKNCDQVIEISDDGSWEMRETSMEATVNDTKQPEIDPFTGNPILMAPVNPAPIAAPPTEFQNSDGFDGVFSASCVSTHSGPSSMTTATDSFIDIAQETPTNQNAPETIPEESVEPAEVKMKTSNDLQTPGTPQSPCKNLGAAIMESYEKDIQRKKESLNLPEVSLLEFGDTVKDLEKQRQTVIKQMTVKAKRKDTWIKTFSMHDKGDEKSSDPPVAPSRKKKFPPPRPIEINNVSNVSAMFEGKDSPKVVSPRDALNNNVNGNVGCFMGSIVAENSFVDVKNHINSIQNAAVERSMTPQQEALKEKKMEEVEEDSPRVLSPENPEIPPDVKNKVNGVSKAVEENKANPNTPISPVQKIPDVPEPIVFPKIPDLPEPIVFTKIPDLPDRIIYQSIPASFQTTPLPSLEPDIKPEPKGQVETSAEVVGNNDLVIEPEVIKREEVAVESAVTAEEEIPKEKVTEGPPEDDAVKTTAEEEEKEAEPEKSNGEKTESLTLESGTSPTTTSPTTTTPTPLITTTAPSVDDDKQLANDKGEVDSGSILETKEATKTYWEQRMQTSAAMEETGWETVANVRFQGDQENTATPPPEFIPAPPPMFDNSPEDSSAPASLDTTPQHLQQQEGPADPEAAPSKQYIYGAKEDDQEPRSARVVETVSKRNSLPKENLIEAEIREQQQKEEELRREGVLKTQQLNLLNAEKDAASTASHDSDEGFVERLVDEPPPPQAQTGRGNEGVGGMRPPYTHTITGERGEPVIYDAVSPPPQFFDRPASSTPSSSSSMHNTETKIALEIRQLREREEELRVMRERISGSRENLLEDDDSRLTSHDSRSDTLLDDHYTSLTTTTDEGNFSECGDPSSEDKSSDGSNSRIMSPEVPPQAPHADYPGRRRVVVKPFEEQEEEQPVYTRMQKESVIEREIRLAREREEAYRREKGLTHAPLVATSSNSSDKVVNRRNTTTAVMSPGSTSSGSPRDVQHRMATSRIQQEIEETSQREKELRAAGKIYTTSEETVDAKLTRGFEEKYILFERPVKARRKKYDQPPQSSGETKKVTRMSDLAEMSNRPSSSNSNISSSSTTSSSSKCLGTPVRSRSPMSPSPTPSPSPFSPPTFTTPSPVASAQPRLTRSLSTTHLASNPGGAANPMRAPKGLMQKFIASRGKMTTSAFASPPSPSSSISPTFTHRTITTRPMKVEPKVAVVRREQEARLQQAQNQQQKSQQQQYRRSYCTAEEKIQEELRDMQQREEELRRHRARQLGRSQPNLSGLILEDEDDVVDGSSSSSTKGMNGHAHLHNGDTPEVNGLRSALSNPNLLDDEQEHTQFLLREMEKRADRVVWV
ncbi:uncharacterized protein LOC143032375 isoform X2 [Oratosquilla oratoria]|uniref:uncharacterized protein LOC143032375 isoform X2 n=1 Tax=Oratosquilla oratoria TaxID=337810 RepID=UPI003F761A97